MASATAALATAIPFSSVITSSGNPTKSVATATAIVVSQPTTVAPPELALATATQPTAESEASTTATAVSSSLTKTTVVNVEAARP